MKSKNKTNTLPLHISVSATPKVDSRAEKVAKRIIVVMWIENILVAFVEVVERDVARHRTRERHVGGVVRRALTILSGEAILRLQRELTRRVGLLQIEIILLVISNSERRA